MSTHPEGNKQVKIAYLDCMSGISGDMTLGALIDAGADLADIQQGIDSLGLPDCRLNAESVRRHGFRATHVTVEHEPEHAHRHLHHITEMIQSSRVDPNAQELAQRIFECLGAAEAHVHGVTIEKVHFHEVGAVDSIADIVGAAIGFTQLGVEQVICSPIATGQGTIEIAHGRVSVPAPATAELLRNVPLVDCPVEAELATPTGAAIAKTLASRFGSPPTMTLQAIGYGAGSRDLSEQANVLRIMLGDAPEQSPCYERITVLETNLDDCSPEVIAYACERLLAEGALDVFTTAITMKKGRPGWLLTVLAEPQARQRLELCMLTETPTIGVRAYGCDRIALPRQQAAVSTAWGNVTVKVVRLPDGSDRVTPEFGSCRTLALEHKVPIDQIYDAVTQILANRSGSGLSPDSP